MVFLALDAKAASEAISLARDSGAAVWIGSDAMSKDEHYRIASSGVNLTSFEYPLSGAHGEVIEDSLAIVLEHHPGAIIWVQHAL